LNNSFFILFYIKYDMNTIYLLSTFCKKIDSHRSDSAATEKSVGDALAAVIAWAHENGIDPENALRAKAREMIREIETAEKHT
jgi:NTP pyrophosphatase (non-canonical NTP hydrolase)